MGWLENLIFQKRQEKQAALQRQEAENRRRQEEELARNNAQSIEDMQRVEQIRKRLAIQLASYNPEQLLSDVRDAWDGAGVVLPEEYLTPNGESTMQVSLFHGYPVKAGDETFQGDERTRPSYVPPYIKDGGDGVIISLKTSFGDDSFKLSVKSGACYRSVYHSSFDSGVPMVVSYLGHNWPEHSTIPAVVTKPGERLTDIQEFLAKETIYRIDNGQLPLQKEARSRIETKGLKRWNLYRNQ